MQLRVHGVWLPILNLRNQAPMAFLMKHISSLSALSGLILCAAHAAAPVRALGPASMDSYSQTILVTFKSEVAARQARLHIAPLYHDLRAAFSTRMDDCDLNDLRVAEVMAKFGQEGTFYLNDPEKWWQDSTATGVTVSGDPGVEVSQRLLAGGNSIGGHTLNHEMLPALSKNDAFREIMGVRVALEIKTASPVLSFSYPDLDFNSEFRDGTDRVDLEEMLRRSGFYQLGENHYNQDWDSGLQDALFVICDDSTYGGMYSESILTQVRCEEERPLFLVTMHALVSAWGGPEFPKLAEMYRKWSGRNDWWYCNHNQYAAYRYQALHSRLEASVGGNVLKAVLTRPDPLDLNDWTPLTLRVDGVGKDDVVSAECPGAEVKPVFLAGSYAFDLFHGRERGVITAYAKSDNSRNAHRLEEANGATEGLRALLHRNDHVLILDLRNDGMQSLQEIRVVFRLPLRWQEGVVRKQVESLASGASVTLEIPLTERAGPEHYSDGVEFDLAQVDFCAQRRVRLYAVCEVSGGEPAAFFARGGFWVLGPLPGDLPDFDPQAFAKSLLEGKPPQREYTVPWGGTLVWKALEPAKASILDSDIIPTTGSSYALDYCKWDPSLYFPHKKIHYVLYGRIVSPDNRTVQAVFSRDSVKHLSLNGRMVEGNELNLRKGVNDLRLLYAPTTFAESPVGENNYGCYLRLAGADGKRVDDVRFERPPAP
jgi:peptidoglycan/xylan/chitin deacetylase (PgdA/CDA1 family)